MADYSRYRTETLEKMRSAAREKYYNETMKSGGNWGDGMRLSKLPKHTAWEKAKQQYEAICAELERRKAAANNCKQKDKNKWEHLFDQFLETIDFRLVKYPDGWGLIDQQRANLGNIESDRFRNASTIIDRLDIYIKDYFADEIQEGMDGCETEEWSDLLQEARTTMQSKDLEDYRYGLDVLDMVCNHPQTATLPKRRKIILNNRTLVKVSAGEYCMGFKTISQRKKSPQTFLITRDMLAQLEQKPEIITQDIYSFAALRLNTAARTLTISFSWLQRRFDCELAGWEETAVLPYDALTSFMEASAQKGGPKTWRVLSLQNTVTPQVVFVDTEGLRKCLENRTVRRKLARALRDNFWGADRVVFYHDFESYSFMFQSCRAGRPSITGGLILHDQNDLKKAHYSVHT